MKYFEWDEKKRQANIEKHGIDFVDAIHVFADSNRIELQSARNGEKRYQLLGNIFEVIILVVYTCRAEKKRIISARRASKKERETYYNLR